MNILPSDINIKRGLVIIGKTTIDIKELIDEIVKIYNCELLKFGEDDPAFSEETLSKLREINRIPNEQRNCRVVYLDQEHMNSSSQLLIQMIAEARPLQIIVIVKIDSLTHLKEDLCYSLFGNIANVLIGNLPIEEQILLSKFANIPLYGSSLNLTDQGDSLLLSYLDKDMINKLIKL